MNRLLLLLVCCSALWACPPRVTVAADSGAGGGAAGELCGQQQCLTGSVCLGGSCYPTWCGSGACAAGEVCDDSRCVEAACAGVRCRFGSCSDGGCPACSPLEYVGPDGGCQLLQELGTVCTDDRECALGHCVDRVCCGALCDAACERCDATGTCVVRPALDPGRPGLACFPGKCSGTSRDCGTACTTDLGCAPGAFCSQGVCTPVLATGSPCTRIGECATGQCVAGVCCESACNKGCSSCAPASSADAGQCLPAARGASWNVCGNYRCNGVDTQCPTTCADDSDCGGSTWCSGGVCVPTLAVGQACARMRQCGSGPCQDGVCCDFTCGGGCQRCLADAGCEVKPDGPDDAGACDPAHPFCHAGTCCDTTCTGACEQCGQGTCQPAYSSAPCGVGYRCNGVDTTCPTSCNSTSNCQAPGYTCVGGVCSAGPCAACGPTDCCIANQCVADGACVRPAPGKPWQCCAF